jgi:hypothetical protein
MILSPVAKQDSMVGQNRSNAAGKADVRQFPSRTHTSLTLDLGWLHRSKEILILADQDAVLSLSIAADGYVGSVPQASLENMLAILPMRSQVFRKRLRQLIVDEEFHVRRTTWSV